jgi:hypothetical protein
VIFHTCAQGKQLISLHQMCTGMTVWFGLVSLFHPSHVLFF